ncbi:MAG: hypothetical protein FWG99_02595 [Treponema sp.]|nr:hypothetical protein [Treponema sp.]
MKNLVKLIVSIALAAMIGFTITACDTGSGGGKSKTVIFSLDTVDETSFVITLQGANWDSDLEDDDLALSLRFTGRCIDSSEYESILRYTHFDMVKSSNKALTFTLMDDLAISESATISFTPSGENGSLVQYGWYVTDGGTSVESYGDTTYQLNSNKSSITLPVGKESPLIYTALDTAIANAKAAKAGVEVSGAGDGSEFSPLIQWVTQAALDTLNAAITEAETVRSAATTQEQIDNAVTALNAAMAAFTTAKKAGTQDGGGGSSLIGTWIGVTVDEILTFDIDGNYESIMDGKKDTKGIYSASGQTLNLTITSMGGGKLGSGYDIEKWYTVPEIDPFLLLFVGDYFTTFQGTYSISGDTLTIVFLGNTDVYNRK